MEFLIILAVGFGLMMWFSSRGRAKQEQMLEQTINALEPGTWVRTTTGFYGIFSDIDGEVVILETPSGEETYWAKRSIFQIGDPPFASTDDDDNELVPQMPAESDDTDRESPVEIYDADSRDDDDKPEARS
ncbi:MAG: preprotein translocase subunit YajC [Actinomycetaceae bacterium]|nr:preprotein translocase subunit YajC [Actinomycetaceae bacterium]